MSKPDAAAGEKESVKGGAIERETPVVSRMPTFFLCLRRRFLLLPLALQAYATHF